MASFEKWCDKTQDQRVKEHAEYAQAAHPKQEQRPQPQQPAAHWIPPSHVQRWQIKAAAISVEWDRYNKTYYFLDDAHGNRLRRENGDVLVFDNEEDAKKALETAFRMQGKKCKMCSSNRNNRAELPRLP